MKQTDYGSLETCEGMDLTSVIGLIDTPHGQDGGRKDMAGRRPSQAERSFA